MSIGPLKPELHGNRNRKQRGPLRKVRWFALIFPAYHRVIRDNPRTYRPATPQRPYAAVPEYRVLSDVS